MSKYKHIVVFGYPRAGTTLLYCMMYTSMCEYSFYDKEIEARRAFKRSPKTIKVTKRPLDIRHVGWLAKKVPDVGFILCIRDPRSILFQK